MKATIKTLLILALSACIFNSCKDEDKEVHIVFTQELGSVYSDTILPGGTTITIGIEAETHDQDDVIMSLNVSESKNGGANTTIVEEDDIDANFYLYSNIFTIDTISGTTHKYTFTVTNSDGLDNQASLTVTVQ